MGRPALFLELFEKSYVEYAAARVAYFTGLAPEDLVPRLHVVAVTEQAEVVVCRGAHGGRFLPDGTREPGESLLELARRELVVEPGAVLRGGLVHFTADRADSVADSPYRLHHRRPRAC